MIFVTVGSQIPFDRMIKAVDEWALGIKNKKVFAQIGARSYEPQNFDWVAKMEFSDYEKIILESDFIIAHAGMGTIITAIRHKKPIIIIPRRGHLREHRNDHQWDTANALKSLDGVHIAWDEIDLKNKLENLDVLKAPDDKVLEPEQNLINSLKGFIQNA